MFCCLLYFAPFCFHTYSKNSPQGWLGVLGSLFGAFVLQARPTSHQQPVENQWFLLFALFCSICFHAPSKSSPRGWLSFLGSLFGAIVLQTRPKKSSKNLLKINSFDVCFILLNFASMLLPRALLGAGWAFRAPFLEQLSCKLTQKTIKHLLEINDFAVCFMLLHFASMLLPRALLGAGWAFWVLFLEQLSCNSASMFWLRLLWLPSGSPRPQSAPQL